MSTGTAFHLRTERICQSRAWRQWSGFSVASTYNDFAQPEYAAIRHAAALIDVSPLFKYIVEGPEAVFLTNRVFTQNTEKMNVGQIVYTPWCDPDGSVRQEGTVFRLAENMYQVCTVEPAMGWLHRNAVGLDVHLTDRTDDVATLALQGPTSREVLKDSTTANLDDLRFFRWLEAEIDGIPVMISRTGYTGDLGYEIWIPVSKALTVWDALMEAGGPHHITPCGLEAMDIARVEAGFVLLNVDYISSESAKLAHHKMSPFELGFGWAVKFDKGCNFVGREALLHEKNNPKKNRLVGLEIAWQPLEEAHLSIGIMPDLPLAPCREPVPIYDRSGTHIGRATTRVWSTLLKKYLALATISAEHADPGTEVQMEITVDFKRTTAPARVAKTPFFKPDRMRA